MTTSRRYQPDTRFAPRTDTKPQASLAPDFPSPSPRDLPEWLWRRNTTARSVRGLLADSRGSTGCFGWTPVGAPNMDVDTPRKRYGIPPKSPYQVADVTGEQRARFNLMTTRNSAAFYCGMQPGDAIRASLDERMEMISAGLLDGYVDPTSQKKARPAGELLASLGLDIG